MPACCAAADCKQSTEQAELSFFRFPLEPQRCKQWVKNCGRPDLQMKTPEYLHRNFKLCSKHFDPSCIQKESELKCVLKDGAVPTLFNVKPNKDYTQNSGRKRTRQPAAEDPVKAKKTKDEPQPTVVQKSVTEESGENSIVQNPPPPPPPPDEPETEDPVISKAKETLKVFFKETLAFSGFSIGDNAAIKATKSLGSGPVGQINPICAELIDSNEVLKLGEDVMREEIRNSLRLARFFSILLQDKTNIEGKDQIPVFVRTVTNDGFPQKHLMGFLPCDLDSDSMFHMLVSEIRSMWGLRMEHCRGFTYLASGSLCQKLKEVYCRMLRDYPQVVLAPSDPYAFNMWLIRSLPDLSIQEVVDTVEEVAAILRQSETLTKKLHARIAMAYGHIKNEVDRVKDACQNNWEFGTDAFQTMLDILEPLLNSIGEMCTSALSDVDTAIVEQLLKLKDKLKNFNFIISLVVLKNTLCCVSILNPSLRGIISISSTLQYTISNALKLLNKHLQEIPIFHRKWFSDAVGRAKKLGVPVTFPVDTTANGGTEAKPQPSAEDYFRDRLSKMILQYLIEEVKRVLGIEMVRILRWLSLVPSYMADHNFSIRKDKVADANLNNLARPDSFYDELGCWEVKWRHASKRRILPTSVFATLKIPDIGFYPNVQSLLKVLGSIPCINAEADVYGQYDMALDRYHSYMKEVPAEKRLCNMAFVYVNQDVHFNTEDMVQLYVESHPDIMQLLCKDEMMDVQPSATENNANNASKEDVEEQREMTLDMELEIPKAADCAGTDKEALKSALQAALTAAYNSQSRQSQGGQEGGEVEYVTKSEMNEVLKVCEDVVREGILSEVGNSFFSLFIDRAVRCAEADFLPLFLRFVDSFDVMRLELMGFVDTSLDTESMCQRLYDMITTEWGLDLKYCRGQAYLGSAEVSYKLKAFACKVQEMYPLAICTHCSCYSFNTWWSRSVPVLSVSRAIDILEKIVLFFSSMPELEKELDQVLAVGLRESYEKLHELQGTFCSSWLEKHDSYDVFAQILEPLAQWLELFQSSSPQTWSLAVINQAKKLLQLIRDFDFIVAVVALKNASSFTRELSAALQKDHFIAASQLCQISGIVATLNRVRTNIKVFHQNWFDEACIFAQVLGVQIKVPDSVVVRDNLLKPAVYYKDVISLPLVDHLINSVKDHFSDDHKEALNFLSLVPCSVTVSYAFEGLKSKPPLYIGDLPDPENFFTELSCWKVKWKTRVVSPSVPDTIFQTLRLPLMQYFANINTLLKIMCVLPSTPLEFCGEVKQHKMFQNYLKNTYSKDRSPCLAMLQVGANFNRDLDRMVARCLKVTPKTLEGICLDKESKTLLRNSELKEDVDNHKNVAEDMDTQQILKDKASEIFPEPNEVHKKDNHKAPVEEMDTQQQPLVLEVVTEDQQKTSLEENGHVVQPVDNVQSSEKVFKMAARMARKKRLFSKLPKEEQECIIQELNTCHWDLENLKCISDGEIMENFEKAIRETIVSEVQESPFFSIITDKVVSVDDKKYVPVFVRYVDDCTPKVELIGFLPLDGSSDVDIQAKALSDVLTEEWGLQMGYCRGQSFMCMGASSQGLRKMSLDFLSSYPLAVNTPSESCGLAYWLAVSLHNDPITKVLGIVEDLLLFFDQSPRLHIELSQTMEGLLNTPREALAEVPETCLSRWKRTEDFFDILVDMLEGVLSCLDSVSNNVSSSWSNSMSIHALILSTAIKESDFVIPLVILKNACAPLRNCSTVFRCGNPADIICELEKIPLIVESLNKMLENINTVHATWFEEATYLAAKVAGGLLYPETVGSYESPDVGYRETVSKPVLSGLIEEMKLNFSECHLKALKVLSLLPTCNPLPILPEATDKLYTIYQSDLPEPDTAEEDINTWATAWREKYQDVSPPASISETLYHPEAKSHPNVTALLKLVAVLPSISMECDLMKTTLNSLRAFLKSEIVCNGAKTNAVMLLMHQETVRTLEDVIEKCVENDPESYGFLSQLRLDFCSMQVDAEVAGVSSDEVAIEANGSGGSEEANNTVPDITEEQHVYDNRELDPPVPDDTTVTPEDTTMETNASIDAERIQESTTVPDDTPDAPSALAQDVTEEPVQTITVEPVTDVPVDLVTEMQRVTAEPPKEVETLSFTEMAAQSITLEPVAEVAATSVTVEPLTEVAATSVTAEPLKEVETPSLTEVETQNVTPESVAEVAAQNATTVPLTEMKSQCVTEVAASNVSAEPLTEMETQSVASEPLTEVAAQNATTETLTEMETQSFTQDTLPSVTSEPLTDVTAPNVTSETLTEMETQSVTKEALPSVTLEPLTEVTVPSVTSEPQMHEAPPEPQTEMETQSVPAEPLMEIKAQSVASEPLPEVAAQSVTTETVTEVAEPLTETVTQEVVFKCEKEEASPSVTTEPLTEMETQSVTLQPLMKEAPPSVTTEPGKEVTAQSVTAEPPAEVESPAKVELPAEVEPQSVAPEPLEEMVASSVTLEPQTEVAAQSTTTKPLREVAAQSVTAEPPTEVSVQSITIKPLRELAAQSVTTAPLTKMGTQSVATEPPTEVVVQSVKPLRELAAQSVSTAPLTEVAAQDATTDTVTSAEEVTMEVSGAGAETEPKLAAQDAQGSETLPAADVNLEVSAIQGITTDPVMDAKVQDVSIEPHAAVEDEHMEVEEAEQSAAETPSVKGQGQGVTAENVTVNDDVTLRLSSGQDIIPEPAIEAPTQCPIMAAQSETTETVMEDEKVSLEVTAGQSVILESAMEGAVEDVSAESDTAEDVPMEYAEEVQDPNSEPKSEDIPAEPETAEGVPMELTEVAATEPLTVQEIITEPVTPVQDVPMELSETEVPATDPETDPVAQNTTTEPIASMQDIPLDLSETTRNINADATTITQNATSYFVTAEQNDLSEPIISPISPATPPMQVVGTDSTATVEDETSEQVTSQDASMEPVKETQAVTETCVEAAPDVMESTAAQVTAVEPVMLPQGVSTEPPAVAKNVTREPESEVVSVTTDNVSESQSIPTEPKTDVQDTTKPMIATLHHSTESKAVTTEPITAALDVPSVQVFIATSKTTEPTTAVEHVQSTPEHLNNIESVSKVPTDDVMATEDADMDTTEEEQGVASEPAVTVHGPLVAQDVAMNSAATSDGVTVAPVQDVVMEPSVQNQEISAPLSVMQEVPSEPGTEVQDASICLSEGPAIKGLQESKPQAKVQDFTSQITPAVEVRQPCANPVSLDDAQAMVVTQDGVSQAPTESSVDGKITEVEEIADQNKRMVQDGIAVAQDNTSPPKEVTPAVTGQDNLPQSTAVAHDGTTAHKSVLSFYDRPAQEAILKEHAHSKLFSLIFEQEVEIKGHSYIPVGICYLDRRTLCEDVLAFVPLDEDVTVFVDTMTAALSKCGLKMAFCRGQSFLTVGVAGSQIRAATALLSQRYPQAVRTLSSSVSLNVWLARSSTVTEIADSSMWVEKLLQWFTEDAERRAKLENMVTSLFKEDERKLSELRDLLNKSHWERNHDILGLAVEVLEAILLSLKEMENDKKAETSQAANFLCVFQSFDFILTVVIMKNILSFTKNVSQALQGGPLELYQAANILPDLLSALNDMKLNIDSHLSSWFQEAAELASKLQISVHPSQESVIMHYREVVCRGAIEHSIKEITELFSNYVLAALRCMQVVPYVISEMEGCCRDAEVFKLFQEDLPDWISLQVELQRWREKWLAAPQHLPTCVPDTLKASDLESFPNIDAILKLLVVLPCCRTEESIRPGKKILRELMEQPQRAVPELHPL